MAENDVPERVQLATHEGEFHVNFAGTRMLANGNKIRVVLEGEFSRDQLVGLAPLFDKDCKVRFKEILPKKTRNKVGEEPTPILDGLDEGAGPE